MGESLLALIRDHLPVNQGSDFTVLVDASDLQNADWDGELPTGSQSVEIKCEGQSQNARIQATYCHKRTAVSLTVRADNNFKGFVPTANFASLAFWGPRIGFNPPTGRGTKRLNSAREICDAVNAQLNLSGGDRHGFVIISGSTNSMKSLLARGLIHLDLEGQMKEWIEAAQRRPKNNEKPTIKRRPHLVTCEDDIEQFLQNVNELNYVEDLYLGDAGAPQRWRTCICRPDYTPRHLSTDVKDMAQAVEDALRMTPSIFYAGEVRRGEDFRALYRLAQSHLVVLTTHASSLVNTFAQLRHHLSIWNQSERSEMASAIAGVVHMRPAKVDLAPPNKKETIDAVIPACWIGSPRSVEAFTAEGLSSILPNYARLQTTAGGQQEPYSCLGRRSFAALLLELSERSQPLTSKAKQTFLRKMADWDLQGE